MANEFDFDDLMNDAERLSNRRNDVRDSMSLLSTIAVAQTFFTAAAVLYIDERIDCPGMPKEEALLRATERMKGAFSEHTRPYFEKLMDYNNFVEDPRNNFDTLEEALDSNEETEHMIIDAATKTISRLVETGEAFSFLCGVSTGKTPEEHLARIENDEDDGLGSVLDSIDW
jgi:hypothetical protein